MLITTRSRRAGLGITAVIVAAATLGSLGLASSASAEVRDTLTFNKTSGPVTLFDLPDVDSFNFTTDFSCGEGTTMSAFLTEPGKESVVVPPDATFDSFIAAYPAVSFGPFNVGHDGRPFDPSPFPSTMYIGSTPHAISSLLAPNGSYSFGVVCMTDTENYVMQADADGMSIVAFTRLDTDASGNFKVAVPKADTTVGLVGAQQGVNNATLTATVSSGGAVATAASGTVEFTEGATTVSAPVNAGIATTTIPDLTDGSHNYTATYIPAADADFSGSTSAPITVVISKVRVATSTNLVGTAKGYDAADLTATVSASGATATGAAGTVEFWSDGSKKGESAVADGVATYALTGLTPGQSYSYTAKFVPSATNLDYASSESAAATVAIPALPELLTNGSVVKPGSTYRVEVPAESFAAGATVSGEVHSDPITLVETATVAADGSARYVFVMPKDLAAGSAHELVLTDGTDTRTVAFSVQPAATQPAGTPPGAAVPAAGGNSPAAFHTDWLATTGSTPAGLIAIIGTLLALAAGAAAAGWSIWRRRTQRQS